jgi:hypothetical protein
MEAHVCVEVREPVRELEISSSVPRLNVVV